MVSLIVQTRLSPEAWTGPKWNSGEESQGTIEGIGGTTGAFHLSSAMTVIYPFVMCSKSRFSFQDDTDLIICMGEYPTFFSALWFVWDGIYLFLQCLVEFLFLDWVPFLGRTC